VVSTVVAGLFGVVGVAIGVLGTVFAARFTTAKTIEADRHNRVWEKQSQVYIDAVAGILHKVKVRQCQWQRMTTDTEPEHPPEPVDWPMVEAGMAAYASDRVLEALDQAKIHLGLFDDAFNTFLAAEAAASSPLRIDPEASQRMDDAMEKAKKELPEAFSLLNNLMHIMRTELAAGAGEMHAPQKKENITEMARHDVHA
jgi:hypothetical protein